MRFFPNRPIAAFFFYIFRCIFLVSTVSCVSCSVSVFCAFRLFLPSWSHPSPLTWIQSYLTPAHCFFPYQYMSLLPSLPFPPNTATASGKRTERQAQKNYNSSFFLLISLYSPLCHTAENRCLKLSLLFSLLPLSHTKQIQMRNSLNHHG